MRYSNLFIPTLKENPADAESASHRLLLRAGFVRQLAAGIYSYLPLAQKVLQRIEKIIREEMAAIGAQEFLLPALNPREIWEETGRWTAMGDNMFRLKDRRGADLCLGMTHEEVFTAIARHELRSYKQLPQVWYQIQTKFRDEARPKSGLLRVRQFTMKDSYSFDLDEAGLDVSFEKHREAYCRIFERCGLRFVMVEASSGAMGGSASTEFMVATDAGEDLVCTCPGCGYAANIEKATSAIIRLYDKNEPPAPTEFPTPGVRTIEQLAAFEGGAPPQNQIKSLVYVYEKGGETGFAMALVRGDHTLQETKFRDALGADDLRPADDEEIFGLLGAHPGSLGAVKAHEKAAERGKKVFIVCDKGLRERFNLTTGANRDDFHLRGVSPIRDMHVNLWTDIRQVEDGEMCQFCASKLRLAKSLEIGHIFKLGTKYSASMGATVLDENGRAVPIVMGSYGIGVERIMASVIEQNHDADGIIWTPATAPFEAIVTVTNVRNEEIASAGEKLYEELRASGIDVLLDDRDERAGVKFKDAELIGIPVRVTVGKRIGEGIVEVTDRRSKETVEISVSELAATVRRLIEG